MTMQIKDELNILLFTQLFDIILYSENFWLLVSICSLPAAVQIIPSKISSIITQCNPIYVDHRKYVNIETPNDEFHFIRMLEKFIHNLFNNERPWGLAGMLSSQEHKGLFLCRVRTRRLYYDQWNWLPHQGSSNILYADFRIPFDRLQLFMKIC